MAKISCLTWLAIVTMNAFAMDVQPVQPPTLPGAPPAVVPPSVPNPNQPMMNTPAAQPTYLDHFKSSKFGEPVPQPKQPQQQDNGGMPLLNALQSMMGALNNNNNNKDSEIRGGGSGGGGGGTGGGGEYIDVKNVSSLSKRGTAAVVEPVKQYLPKCTQSVGLGNCRFKNLGTWGDKAHQKRRSCHNTGDAWDLGFPAMCDKGVIQASSQDAVNIANCMANGSDNQFRVIFRNIKHGNLITSSHDHSTHMHIQLARCW